MIKRYAENNLTKDEKIIYEARLHWIIFTTITALFTCFIAPLIEASSTEFVITNKRIILKKGLIALNAMEYNLSKIEAVNIRQGIWGKIFNYGSIVIVGTGGTPEVINYVENPLRFRNTFQELTC